jgi:hypothetical protein
MSDRPGYEFADTNGLVYAHDRSAGQKRERARLLLERLWQNRNGCLSLQVLQEFYVTVTHRVSRPLAQAAAAQILKDPFGLARARAHLARPARRRGVAAALPKIPVGCHGDLY